jgi:hypothetical protein
VPLKFGFVAASAITESAMIAAAINKIFLAMFMLLFNCDS